MKPRFEPANLSLIGVFVAAPACGLNALVAGLFTGEVSWVEAPGFFFGALAGALLLCFPLCLISEHIGDRWMAGSYKRARLLSAISFLVTVLCLKIVMPDLSRPGGFSLAAALLIPLVWAILFLIFALFARPPKT